MILPFVKIQISEETLVGERVLWELTDYPMDVVINKTVWVSYDTNIKIYGVSKETMECLKQLKEGNGKDVQ